jgi:hypothetical protein
LNEPSGVAADAATILFNLPDYRVISTTVIAGRRQVIVETTSCQAVRVAAPPGPGLTLTACSAEPNTPPEVRMGELAEQAFGAADRTAGQTSAATA